MARLEEVYSEQNGRAFGGVAGEAAAKGSDAVPRGQPSQAVAPAAVWKVPLAQAAHSAAAFVAE